MPRISGYLRTHDGVGLPHCRLELWAGGGTSPGAAVAVAPRPVGAARTPVAVTVRADRLVLGNLHTDERGRFAIDYPALAAGELPFLKYFLEDRRHGTSSTVFSLTTDGTDVWSVRFPDHVPGTAARFITPGDRLDIRPPRRVVTFARGGEVLEARVHRASLAYEIATNQLLWFEGQMADARRHVGDFVRAGFVPPAASRLQLPQLIGEYVGGTLIEPFSCGGSRLFLAPDNGVRRGEDGKDVPTETSDADYQDVIPHEVGHHIFEIGHPWYSPPVFDHDLFQAIARHHYYRSYLADTEALLLSGFGGSNMMLHLLDPSGRFRAFAAGQARIGAYVQQMAEDFSEGYATYVGKCFNSRRSPSGWLETPARQSSGVGDQPTTSFLWDLSDQTTDGGADRLGIPFGVVHMLCVKWGERVEAGHHDIPATVRFGTTATSPDPGIESLSVEHDALTLPGFFTFLRENLNDRYRARLDALVRPNRLVTVFYHWNYMRQQHGLPPLAVAGVPAVQLTPPSPQSDALPVPPVR